MPDHVPPVNEVVLSLAIAPQERLVGPYLPSLLGSWFDDHPEVQIVGPLQMPVEFPFPVPQAKSFGFADLQQVVPEPRYWLSSFDENSELLQVQRDFLALNWRRRSAEQEYVHYARLRERFAAFVGRVAESLAGVDGYLQPLRAEMTYVNVIEPGGLWSDSRDLHRVFRFGFPGDASYENVAGTYSKPLLDEGGAWAGRVHVSLQTGFDPLKEESRAALTLTARAGNFLDDTSLDEVLRFMDLAHVHLNQTFYELLTSEAREQWGLTDGG